MSNRLETEAEGDAEQRETKEVETITTGNRRRILGRQRVLSGRWEKKAHDEITQSPRSLRKLNKKGSEWLAI